MVGSTFLNILENWYRVNGIWTNKSDRKFNWKLILFSFVSLAYNIISCTYLAYLNIEDLELFTEILLHFLYSVIVAYIWIVVLINHRHLASIYSYIESKSDIYCSTPSHEGTKPTIERAEKYIMRVVKLFVYSFLTTLSIRGILTLLFHRKRKLIFPLWLPFGTDTNLYYLAFVYEIIVYVQFISVIYGLSILYFGFSTFYPTLLRITGETFNRIEKLTENKNWQLEHKHKEYKILEDMIMKVIREHENINRSLQDLKPILGSIFLGISVLLEICMCFVVFNAIQKNTMDALIETLLLTSCFLFVVYTCCWCGNKFQDMNDIFRDTVYGCPWYCLPTHCQMTLLVVLRYLTKPMNISSVTLAEPTLSAFVLILQTAYSYLNILLALSAKKDRKE